MLIQLVTRKILDKTVSELLITASREVHREESEFFQQATKWMSSKDITFWVGISDSQFWLDDQRYF